MLCFLGFILELSVDDAEDDGGSKVDEGVNDSFHRILLG